MLLLFHALGQGVQIARSLVGNDHDHRTLVGAVGIDVHVSWLVGQLIALIGQTVWQGKGQLAIQ
ncbi:hypothetical protein D3C80_1663560 [compost metagenome]